MLQKEVIHRLAAKQGSGDYGYISIFTRYYADAKILFDVSPKCFNPAPKVTSSVIRLTNKGSKAPDPVFFELVKRCFSMRRKTILNCLTSFKNLEKSQANEILITCALDTFLRPDKLSIADYLRLTAEIKKYIILQS
jgi:16S rRNA (adenine1518-N6/adenine1519-N6)-dimethyltransferase